MATMEEIEREIERRQAGAASSPGLTPEQRKRIDFKSGLRQLIDEEVVKRSRPPVEPPPTREELLAELAAEQGPLDALAIGAGRGLTTIGRAVGLAEPEDPIAAAAFQELEEQQPAFTTAGEIIGESAPFLLPGVGAAALPGRAAQFAGAATLGALEGGLITRGRGGSLEDQAVGAGTGGVVAGALDLVLPRIGRIGRKIVRRTLGREPAGAVVDAAGNPSQELVQALDAEGLTFDDLMGETVDALRRQAPADPRQALRKAFLEEQGLESTRAQMTRRASDFQAQQEAAKTSTAVRDALEGQEAVLTSRFNNAVLETAGDPASQASTVTDFILDKSTVLDRQIGDLYNAARQALPTEKNVRFESLTKKLRSLFPADRRAGGNIKAIVGDMQEKGILDKKGKLIGSVTVERAEDLRKLMNELYDEKNPFGNSLLRQLKDTLDDDVFSAAGDDFFKQARKAKTDFEKGLSRAKISKFDSRKDNVVRDLLENKLDPDQLTEKVVFGKRWRPTDLQQIKDYLSTDEAGKAAFDDLRADVLQRIKERAFTGPVDEAGNQALSPTQLRRAVKAVGDKKLGVLFSKDEMKFLQDMLKVAELREPVRGTALGLGPSAQAVARLERKLDKLPAMRSLIEFFDREGKSVLKAKPEPFRTRPSAIAAAARDITPSLGAAGAVALQE